MATQHTARTRRPAHRASRRVVRKLLVLTERMRDTAQELELFGCPDKARELRGAASIASGWLAGIQIDDHAVERARRVAA